MRRNLRSIPLPSHTNLGQTFYKINANRNTPTIIKLTSQPTHYLPNLSNVVRTWRETKTIKTFLSLTTKQVKERKDYNLLKTNISNIWLTDGGRVALNNIMDHQLNSSFDLLTQNDLLTIFKKLTPHCILKIINNYKSATGIGNMVLEAITILIETHLNLPTTFNLINKKQQVTLLSKTNLIINKIFNKSELCQYTDQINALSELSHNNRLTQMGQGGLTPRTTKITIRDIHQ